MSTKFTFMAPVTLHNKVSCIKAVRILTGLGLKESKDAVETPGKRQTFTKVALPAYEEAAQIRILTAEGFEIGPTAAVILEKLRDLGSQALFQGEDELANEILQVVLAEKLRRQPQ